MDYVTWDPIIVGFGQWETLQEIEGQRRERSTRCLFLLLHSFFIVLATAASFYNHSFCLVDLVW